MGLGNQLEKQGWLQASLINKAEAEKLLQCTDTQVVDVDIKALLNDDFVFVVANQSCDIARNDVATIQLLVARIIEKRDPQKSYNSNPRYLDTFYSEITAKFHVLFMLCFTTVLCVLATPFSLSPSFSLASVSRKTGSPSLARTSGLELDRL